MTRQQVIKLRDKKKIQIIKHNMARLEARHDSLEDEQMKLEIAREWFKLRAELKAMTS